MRPLLLTVALVCSSQAFAQIAPRHVPPSDTTVPVGARLQITALGEGVQIYVCTRRNDVLGWTSQAPEAKLLDPATHVQLGTHGAGPMWKWNDGSAIGGKVIVSQAALEPNSVPWLLLAASPLGKQQGLLSTITYVRRSETSGGLAPSSACDAAHEGQSARTAYHALYTFYSTDTPTVQTR